MTEVERLAAIEEFKLVKSRYFRFGDTKDLVSMRTLFADDCVVDFSGSVTDPTTGVQGGDKTSHWNAGVVLSVAA